MKLLLWKSPVELQPIEERVSRAKISPIMTPSTYQHLSACHGWEFNTVHWAKIDALLSLCLVTAPHYALFP